MSPMSCKPIVTCTYGWGKSARLYSDVLTLNGRLYELADLENVQARYHRFLGISSARLILRFQKKTLLLRGIANVVMARQMETYLEAYVREHQPLLVVEEDAVVDAALSLAEEKTLPLEPVPSLAEEKTLPLEPVPSLTEEKTHPLEPLPPLPETEESSFWEYGPSQAEAVASAITEAQPVLEGLTEELAMNMAETSREENSPWKKQRELLERRRLRLRRLREERVLREHGFDVLALARRLRTERLPVIEGLADLQEGEVAHYHAEAMLCGEPLVGAFGRKRSRHRIKDQGVLILTNMRMLYVGRQRQMTLSYEHLREVSRTHCTVSFLGDDWGCCQLFEVHRPLEVTMYLECILQHYAPSIPDDAGQVSSHSIPTTPVDVWSQENECEILEKVRHV